MRKIWLIIGLFVFMGFFVSRLIPVTAAEEQEKIETERLIGSIASIDEANSTIELQNILGGWKRKIDIKTAEIKLPLTVGRTIQVIVKKGTDEAVEVKRFYRKKSVNQEEADE